MSMLFEGPFSRTSLRSFRLGSTSIAITAACILGLAVFSIVDYREIHYQKREHELTQLQKKVERDREKLASWLNEKEAAFQRYLSIADLVEEELSSDEPQSDAFDGFKQTVDRIESQLAIMAGVQAETEEFLWHMPSISPVPFSDDFTLAAGPLRGKRIRSKVSGMSSDYGMRMHPKRKSKKMHYGVDIFCPIGTNVIATANGTVRFAGRYRSNQDNLNYHYGNFVVIRHGETGVDTLYAHLSKVLVRPGQLVKRGDKIALSGNTGRSTGPHLHYEIIRNGEKVNPLNYINDVPLVQKGRKLLYIKKGTKHRRKKRGRRT